MFNLHWHDLPDGDPSPVQLFFFFPTLDALQSATSSTSSDLFSINFVFIMAALLKACCSFFFNFRKKIDESGFFNDLVIGIDAGYLHH